jgi:hypothetical protein
MTREPTDVKPLEQVLLMDYFATPSPTFDASQVKTAMPAAAESCDIQRNEILFNETILGDFVFTTEEREEYLLRYLAEYGTLDNIREALGYELGDPENGNRVYFGDLTNDGVMDALLSMSSHGGMSSTLYFVHCMKEKYTLTELFDVISPTGYSIILVEDINLDGLDEVILIMNSNIYTSYWNGYFIFGWTGESFGNLILQPRFLSLNAGDGIWRDFISLSGVGAEYPLQVEPWEIKDVDGNGTLEFIVHGGLETSWDGIAHGPYQTITQTYMWNGEGYVLDEMALGAPEYRYQAVQNGDLYTLLKDYDRARTVYRQAIENQDLKWWSDETRAYIRAQLEARLDPHATPTLGVPDENEYPNLAAYAQFRLILLDVLQDDLESAKQQFFSMQENYREGNEGYIFVEYADAFLTEYQNSQEVTLSCTAAHEFGMWHEAELLKYLDIDHGFQSMSYLLDSLCPFR